MPGNKQWKSQYFALATCITLSWGKKLSIPEGLTEGGMHFERNCRLTIDGQEYAFPKDYFETTEGYEPCGFWEDRLPVSQLNEKGLDQNFCRNPGNYDEPYCFSSNSSNVEKQKCQVPFCPELNEYRTSSTGLEFQGSLDLRKERSCIDICTVYQHLGPSCRTKLRDSSSLILIPCDVPLQNEIPLLNTTYRARRTTIPLTTWYVHESSHQTDYTGSGEMLIRLPEFSRLKTVLFKMSFRIRLADPQDVHSFHLNINLLPEETLEDYYNISISRSGLEIQRIIYKHAVPSEKKETSRDEYNIEVETSGKYQNIPFLTMRYDWVSFVVEVDINRVSLYYKGQEKPVLEMRVPFDMFGASKWKFNEHQIIQSYRTPKFINLHSLKGTIMVAIEEVNGEYYECVKGKVKIHIQDDNLHLHPIAVMPTMYFEYDDPEDELQYRKRPRELTLKLINIPAAVLFTSAPLYNYSDANGLISVRIDILERTIDIQSCQSTKSVTNDMKIVCNLYMEWVIISLRESIKIGEAITLSVRNYIRDSESYLKISVLTNGKNYERSVSHPVYLRFWMVRKERFKGDATISHYGPLVFSVLSTRCKGDPSNSLMSDCLTGERSSDGKVMYPNYLNNYGGQISWTKTGKSCIPWKNFENFFLTLLFNDQRAQSNYCSYIPEERYRKRVDKDKEQTDPTELARSFWCFVSLNGAKEPCDIPYCNEIATEIGCALTYEYECHHLKNKNKDCKKSVCYTPQYPLFMLDLNVPFSEEGRPRNQIFHAEEGFVFHLRSYSYLLKEPVCVYLYHVGAVYPVAKFVITNDSLSLGHQTLPWYNVKAFAQSNSYYLNSWCYNTYIITQSEIGWNLLHEGNLHPLVTYYTAHKLYQVQFGSCDYTSQNVDQTGQLVAIEIDSPSNAHEVREALVLSAKVDSRRNETQVDRFYFLFESKAEWDWFRRKVRENEAFKERNPGMPLSNWVIWKESIKFWIMETSGPISLNVMFYRYLPWPYARPLYTISLTNTKIILYYKAWHPWRSIKLGKVNFGTGFSELKISLQLTRSSFQFYVAFGQLSFTQEIKFFTPYFGLWMERGAVKIVTLKKE